MTRRLVPVLVVALVVLAGCTAPGTPATDAEATADGTTMRGTATTTSAGTATTTGANATGPLERGPTPPGVTASANGSEVVVNASALLAAHDRVLRADGFRATRVSRVAYGDEPLRNSTAVVVAGPNLTRFRSQTTEYRENSTVTTDVWQNETTALVRTTVDGNTSYQDVDGRFDASELTRPPALEGVLEDEALQFSVANVTTRDGRRVFTLTATASAANESADATNGTYTARVVVDERGVVSAYHVRQNATGRDITHEWTLESLGATPTRPAWTANVSGATRQHASERGNASASDGTDVVRSWWEGRVRGPRVSGWR